MRNTLLRISGAIQVLEEKLAKENQTAGNEEEQVDGQNEVIAKMQ